MISKQTKIRIARPTDHLQKLATMYIQGLGFQELSSFQNHNGFDGVILGHKQHSYHLEFTHHRGQTVGKAPSKDHLLVFYLTEFNDWKIACQKAQAAGFKKVQSYNPFWEQKGLTLEDIDGYRIVLQQDYWDK